MAKKNLPSINLNKAIYNRGKQDIQSWLQAWLSAESRAFPRQLRLIDLYDMIMLDSHLKAIVRNRKNKVKGEPFNLVNSNDETNPILEEFFNRSWFTKFINHSLDSIFFGHSLIEISEMDIGGEISKVKLVERRNVVPDLDLILVNPYDTTGYNYTEPSLVDYYIPIQFEDKFGLLLEAAYLVIYKRFSAASWSKYLEKYGLPIVVVKTDKEDGEKLDMVNALRSLGADGVGAIGVDDELVLQSPSGSDASGGFEKKIIWCNSELSKLVLGQTMTTDDGSSRSQGEVHERVGDEIAEADMQMIQNIVNDYLIPRMVKLGYPSELLNWKFEYDAFTQKRIQNDLDNEQKEQEALSTEFERIEKLLPYYNIPASYITERFGIQIDSEKKKDSVSEPEPTVDLENIYSSIELPVNSYIDDLFSDFVSMFMGVSITELTLQSTIAKKMISKSFLAMLRGFDSEIDFDTVDDVAKKAIQENIYMFSGAKTAALIEDFNKLLYDADGKRREYNEFKKLVDKLNVVYNKHHLNAEYNFAVTTGQIKSRWASLTKSNPDQLLTFDAVGDGRTTPLCNSLDGITLPASDSFWDIHTPPNHWSCRSTIRLGLEISEPVSALPIQDDMFKFNPAKGSFVFSENHPYFLNLSKTDADYLKSQYKNG